MTPLELIKQMESEGIRLRILDEEVDLIGPNDVILKFWDLVVLNESAIWEILVERALFEPLIQPKDAYKVPSYTDTEKHQMIESYIDRWILELKAKEFEFEQEIEFRLRNPSQGKSKESE